MNPSLPRGVSATGKARSETGAPSQGKDAGDRNVRNAKAPLNLVQLALTVLTVLVLVRVAVWVALNPRFEWGVVGRYLFAEPVLHGLAMTLALTALCMVLGSFFGVVLAVMKIGAFAPFRAIATGAIWLFRAVPMLVQLTFWFNLAYLVPRIAVGVPFGPEFFSWDTNDLINAFTAAVIGLTIHEAVYMAEIVRAGIGSVDAGQRDAARALGYKEGKAFTKFILPQALRVIIPPTGSQVIGLMKGTSLVSVIGMTDLLHATQIIYSTNYKVVPLLLVASSWYLVLIGVLTYFQSKLETRFSRGYSRTSGGPRGAAAAPQATAKPDAAEA